MTFSFCHNKEHRKGKELIELSNMRLIHVECTRKIINKFYKMLIDIISAIEFTSISTTEI